MLTNIPVSFLKFMLVLGLTVPASIPSWFNFSSRVLGCILQQGREPWDWTWRCGCGQVIITLNLFLFLWNRDCNLYSPLGDIVRRKWGKCMWRCFSSRSFLIGILFSGEECTQVFLLPPSCHFHYLISW